MRLGVVNDCDQCLMVIAPLRNRDASRLACPAFAAFGNDKQVACQYSAGFQGDPHARLIAFLRGNANRHVQRNQRLRGSSFMQFLPEQPVLKHLPQIAILFRRYKIERSGFQPIADPNLLDRAAMTAKRFPKAKRCKHFHACARYGRGPPVKARCLQRRRVGAINDMA